VLTPDSDLSHSETIVNRLSTGTCSENKDNNKRMQVVNDSFTLIYIIKKYVFLISYPP